MRMEIKLWMCSKYYKSKQKWFRKRNYNGNDNDNDTKKNQGIATATHIVHIPVKIRTLSYVDFCVLLVLWCGVVWCVVMWKLFNNAIPVDLIALYTLLLLMALS